MNRFKFFDSFKNPSKHQNSCQSRSRRREQIQLIMILEKCTQILRDDRIWIRNKIKEEDINILSIFRKYKKPLNLQSLQIQLRKHINRIKQRYKEQQLNRLKNNMRNSTYIHEKIIKEQSKKVINKKYEIRQDNEYYNSYENNGNNLKNMNRKFQQQYNYIKRKHAYFPQTIQEEQEPEKLSSCKSQKNHHTDIDNIYQKNLYQNRLRKSLNKSQGQRNRIFSTSFHSQNENGKNNLFYDFVQKHTENLMTPQSQSYSTNKKNLSLSFYENNKPNILQNAKDNDAHLKNGILPMDQSFISNSNEFSRFSEKKILSKLSQENLFTPPQLLQQCRNIIKKNESSKKKESSKTEMQSIIVPFRNFTIAQNDFTFKPTPQYNSKQYNKSNYQNFSGQKKNISSTLNINLQLNNKFIQFKRPDIDNQTVNEIPKESNSLNRYTQNIILVNNQRIQDQYAEDIFQIIFDKSINKIISTKDYEKKIYDHFKNYQNYRKLFTETKNTTKLNISQVGRILEKNCKLKPNQARYIFGLIDIQKNEYFTLNQYQRFLSHFIEQDQANFLKIQPYTNKILEMLDIKSKIKIDYWTFFSIKDTKQFLKFSDYLSQFDFQIEA